jgi:uncharacterized protein (DUF1800 family)
MNGPVTTAWDPYEPTESAPWNLRRVVHLHRRAGFAAPWNMLQRDLHEGPEASVGRLLQGQLRTAVSPEDFESLARTIGDAACASGSADRLKAWWFYRMLHTPDPLGERLTLMWHNHFATSNRKVEDLVLMREQNELLRQHARGEFAGLLAAVVKHPAMLDWLDADSNRKGQPNENLARELMELFTIGIGNYTETDVREAARALTGWSVVDKRFEFRAARHDDGQKRVLGNQGPLDGDDLLELLLEHPATARRIAWRICHTLLGEDLADQAAIAQLADGLRAQRLDIGWAVATVLRSNLFFSQRNLGTRVAGPVEYIVGALRSLELCDPPPSTLTLAEWSTRCGQDLFYPPNVGGWNEGRTWLASRTIVARANFAAALAEGQLWHPTREPDLEELSSRHGEAATWREAADWFAKLMWGTESHSAVAEVIAAVAENETERPLSQTVALLLARPEYHAA